VILTAHVRLFIRGKSNTAGECTIPINVIHFCMHDVGANRVEREFFNRWMFSDDETFHVSRSAITHNARQI
jgi:hypothetical protein